MEKENQFSDLLSKHSNLFYVFLFTLGVLIAGLATLKIFQDELWQGIYSNVVTSVAAALMVTTFIFFLRELFGITDSKDTELQTICQAQNLVFGSDDCGLKSVYDRMGNYGSQRNWIDLIDTSTEHVDIMGRSLYGWTQSSETVNVIVKKIIEGVSFRWLIMHENNLFLPQIVEQDVNIGVELTEKIKAVCKLLNKVHERIPSHLKENFQVRQFKNAPLYFSILHVDDNVFLNQYLFSANSDNSPLFRMKGNYQKWPRIFIHEFETIWNVADEPTCEVV